MQAHPPGLLAGMLCEMRSASEGWEGWLSAASSHKINSSATAGHQASLTQLTLDGDFVGVFLFSKCMRVTYLITSPRTEVYLTGL